MYNASLNLKLIAYKGGYMPNMKHHHLKHLVAGLLVVGLGISSISFANGYTKPAAQAPAENEVMNDGTGVYIGLQAGIAEVDEGDGIKDYVDNVFNYDKSLGNVVVEKNSDQENFGGHAFIGYGFNKYIGMEIGGSFLPENKYSVSAGNIYDIDEEMETYDLDAMVRLSLPLGNAWTIYARGGIAYVSVKFTDSDDSDLLDTTNHAARPIYGLGISYNITKSIGFDASWLEINGKDKTSFVQSNNPVMFGVTNMDDVIPTVDMFMLGITYRFNDLF